LKTSQETIEIVRDYILSCEEEESGDRYKLKVLPEVMNKVIGELIQRDDVSDLSVENQPIEEIILDILSERSAKDDQVYNAF